MKAKHLVETSFPRVSPYVGLSTVKDTLLKHSFLVVMDQDTFLGILTPSDIVKSPRQLAIDCLHDKPHIDINDDHTFILSRMKKTAHRILPVFEGEAFKGVIQQQNLITFMSEIQEELQQEISSKIDQLNKRNLQMEKEIKRRRKAETRLKSLLNEKDILLRELYHRTKNNMQVICSLLDLQSHSYTKDELIIPFKEMENRIRAMAMVHEKLYQSKDLSCINLGEYIRDLATFLMHSYSIDEKQIKLSVKTSDVTVVIDIAIPCGLIINELMSNASKHAFPDHRTGEITVILNHPDKKTIELQISDNGIGISEDRLLRSLSSMGLKIVTLITERQLKGSVSFKTENGVSCRIRFPKTSYFARV
ncbi:CBS domain-containing protein [bacterium]|nr:CBS domain-containing protein [candidate division CSSED10-310 bacterium]